MKTITTLRKTFDDCKFKGLFEHELVIVITISHHKIRREIRGYRKHEIQGGSDYKKSCAVFS